MNNHNKLLCHKKFYGYMFICRNSEGVHVYLLKCCRGIFSSVGMLKRYMVRERLGTPDIDSPKNPDLNRKSQLDTKLSESFYYLCTIPGHL